MPGRSGRRRPRGGRGQRGSVRHVDDVAAVVGVGDAECDAQCGVGSDRVGDDPGRSLGGEHQVDAEAAASLRDVDETVDELRQLPQERRELVDDHDERRGRVDAGVARRELAELLEVADVVTGEQALTSTHLGAQRRQCPPRETVAEVGDEPHRVGERGQLAERSAALVVHEQQAHPVRWVVQCERRQQGSQQLALARSRRAGDQGVGAVETQVDVGGRALCPPHRSAQSATASGPGRPAISDPRGVAQQRRFVEHIAERDLLRLAGGRGVDIGLRAEPGQGAGQRFDLVEVQLVRHDAVRAVPSVVSCARTGSAPAPTATPDPSSSRTAPSCSGSPARVVESHTVRPPGATGGPPAAASTSSSSTRSPSTRPWQCGTHRHQRQVASRPGPASTRSDNTSGPIWASSWATMDRATAGAVSSSPTTAMPPVLARSTATGPSSVAPRSATRSASARSERSPPARRRTRLSDATGPSPTRIRQCGGERSQSRSRCASARASASLPDGTWSARRDRWSRWSRARWIAAVIELRAELRDPEPVLRPTTRGAPRSPTPR